MVFRSRFSVALFVFSLTALPAFADLASTAQWRAVIIPAGPTSITPIEVRVSMVACFPESHTIERTGNVFRIHITLEDLVMTCDLLGPTEYRLSLGTLPVGEYRLEITVADLPVMITRTFIVRNGSRTAMEVHPFAIPVDPYTITQARLHANGGPLCGTVTCDDVTVRVGGVLVHPLHVTPMSDGALFFTPPDLDEGLFDVVVTYAGGSVTLPGALYYYDWHREADPSIFERILFPILEQSGGAHGSQWVSEAAIANPKPWPIVNFNYVEPFVCILIDHPCYGRLEPGEIRTFNGELYPQGVLLHSPRAEAPNLAFSLRVRDTSRQAEGFGTQIPIVRESDMFTNTDLTLLDVPIDPLYRTKVRMYVLDSDEHTAQVTVIRPNEASVTERSRQYEVPVAAHVSWKPGYAEFDLPAGRADERANIYIRIGDRETPSWAFASVTNNETQQVTIVTADGSGGMPVCEPCLP